jgi:hypothetical protein
MSSDRLGCGNTRWQPRLYDKTPAVYSLMRSVQVLGLAGSVITHVYLQALVSTTESGSNAVAWLLR